MKKEDLSLLLRHLPLFLRLALKKEYDTNHFVNYAEFSPERLSELFCEWSNDINRQRDGRIHAIEYYCGYISEKINMYLRRQLEYCDYEGEMETLRKLICNAPIIPGRTIIYRAIPVQVLDALLVMVEKEGFYVDRGFLSTSLNLNGIANFQADMGRKKHVLKLFVQCDTHALYVEDIHGYGMGRGEQELILPPGAKITPLSIPHISRQYGYTIYDCLLTYEE